MCFATVRAMIELDDLRDLPLFEGVSDATLSRVAAQAADVRVDAGQWLVREGESAAFYVLLSGSCDLMKRYPDGVRRIAVRDEPGDYLGDLPIVFGAPFFAGARAVTPMRVARFDRAQFGLLVRDVRGVQRAADRGHPAARRGPRDRRRPSALQPPDRDRPRARSGLPRPARLPLAQPGALRVGRSGRRLGRGAARPRRTAIAAAADCSVVLLPDGRILERPSPSELAAGGRPAGRAAAATPTTSWSSAAARRASRQPCTAPRRACARCSSSARRPAARPARRRASRTTSASRAASRATTSRRGPREQALRLGAEIVVTRSIEAIRPNDDCHTVTLDGGRALGARAVILATGVSYRALQAEGSTRSPASASSTAPRAPRPRRCRAAT